MADEDVSLESQPHDTAAGGTVADLYVREEVDVSGGAVDQLRSPKLVVLLLSSSISKFLLKQF